MKIVIAGILGLCSLISAAQKNTILLSPDSRKNFYSAELEVLTDTTSRLDFNQIRADSIHFRPGADIGRPGKFVYWLRARIKSGYNKDVTLLTGSVWWDYSEIYLVMPDSSVKKIKAGLLLKKSERGKDFTTFVLPAGKEIIYYARLSSSGFFRRMETVNVFFADYELSLENERYRLYLSAILFGILIGFAFYNLSFAFSNRDGSYVWYFVYLASFALAFAGQLGSSPSYLTQFFMPEHPLLGLFLKRLSDPVAFGSIVMFSRTFLNTRKNHPLLDKLLVAVIFLMITNSLFWLAGLYNSNLLGIGLYLVAVTCAIVAGITAWRDQFKAARFFIFGQVLIFIGLLISIFELTANIDILSFLPSSRFFAFIRNSNPFFLAGVEALVFSLALADRLKEKLERLVQVRTHALNDSIEKIKATQQQLIQSEKMASLGELTAGIAHEIQNPLNFVNNFSEVNKELSEELEAELKSGNSGSAVDIARDIRENSEKINHHGKRAESIVKGMLQHSRTSSGQKEPTDINALCDEYLRLAYHGLRAKDKSFNARYETHFDPDLPPVHVVPQDIGRVILNLVNNAFYAVSEKKAKSTEPYDPTVILTTRKLPGKIEITVEDNGPGIPDKIKDKIFQPFFTTKPTGQGTGLGLSLAYDIITKGHGGELKVEALGSQGTRFLIAMAG